MPVLLGVFLYMGFVSLAGQQFVQRITILFMPMKHQPDYPWLRVVHLKRVHLFTLIQMISLSLVFVIEYTHQSISWVFPIMVLLKIVRARCAINEDCLNSETEPYNFKNSRLQRQFDACKEMDFRLICQRQADLFPTILTCSLTHI